MSLDPLNVAVLGPGGVGGFLASMLAREGSSVLMLAGDSTARAIAKNGLQLESPKFGNFTVPVRTASRLADSVDACLITVKATQLDDALERVPADAVGQALIIPFLNGIDHIDHLRALYPAGNVVAATIRIETARVAAGVIRQTSPFASVEVAPSPENRPRVESIAAHLTTAGLDVRARDDELAMLWEKFAFLGPLALLTTHERASVGAIRIRRREDLLALIDEFAGVAGAEGVDFDRDVSLSRVDALPESMETSMQRDQAAGRPLELDALGGALLRRAARAGIPVPVTRRLVDELQARSGPPTRAGSES
jgi:2-dehydropantoate 2-reductase